VLVGGVGEGYAGWEVSGEGPALGFILAAGRVPSGQKPGEGGNHL
jgi:hypothetical protein